MSSYDFSRLLLNFYIKMVMDFTLGEYYCHCKKYGAKLCKFRKEKRKTNPTVEKIMDICNVLQITPEQLLTGKGIEDEEEIAAASPESKFTPGDIQMIEDYHNLREEQQKRLMAYVEALKKIESLEEM
ncbi:hypothetical protein [Butyrivibrio sp. AE2032]|uniref:hypothetical protein n=1 Tax=Butyrivibrio sp. AE2032 TaxID=1458463 RepID=UPI00163A8C3E|nr:hypothetical protein [Butyrivibrio sp. AE2032]